MIESIRLKIMRISVSDIINGDTNLEYTKQKNLKRNLR